MKATIGTNNFIVESAQSNLLVNGVPLSWDLVQIRDNHFHVIYQNKSYQAETVKIDAVIKSVTLKINNHLYTVHLKDKLDLLLEKMGMSQVAVTKISFVKAPMPGLVLNIKVKVGDQIKVGDQLLILEAMKMENILKSPTDGVVQKINVKKGDSVEKNCVLLEF